MATTVGASNITFNDSTTQGTAWAGYGGQVFNSSGTFTIPTGVTKIKATIIGGSQGAPLTVGFSNNFGGNTGGNSSISSGTQTISTVTGNGGSGQGTWFGSGGDGGGISFPCPYGGSSGSGGDMNWKTSGMFPNGANAQGTSSGGGNAGGMAIKYLTGLTPGLTITVSIGGGGSTQAWGGWAGFWASGPGNAGQVIFEW